MINWSASNHDRSEIVVALDRVILECCRPLDNTPQLCCIRGGRAVQLVLPDSWRRATQDVDLYYAAAPYRAEPLIAETLTRLYPGQFTGVNITGRPFRHESLFLQAHEVQVYANGRLVKAQITQPLSWPNTIVVKSETGSDVCVLDPTELVAEKLLKFSTHSVHRHNSRTKQAFPKHLSDLFLVLAHCHPSPERCAFSCRRVLAQEKYNEGDAPKLLTFFNDVEATLSLYTRDLPHYEQKGLRPVFPPVADGEIRLYLAQAATACRKWLHSLKSLNMPECDTW